MFDENQITRTSDVVIHFLCMHFYRLVLFGCLFSVFYSPICKDFMIARPFFILNSPSALTSYVSNYFYDFCPLDREYYLSVSSFSCIKLQISFATVNIIRMSNRKHLRCHFESQFSSCRSWIFPQICWLLTAWIVTNREVLDFISIYHAKSHIQRVQWNETKVQVENETTC